MGRLLHGTSSWSERSWVGPFYPPGSRPAEFLGYYASRFPAVEADVTYYRIPQARMVDGWAERTPEEFVIAAKFPRAVVHAGEKSTPDASRLLVPEHVERTALEFVETMGRLGPRCGPLVLQFPYLNRKAFEGPGPFLERLDRFLGLLPAGFRYAVEIRNRNWLGAELVEVLTHHRAALVLVEHVYMPHPALFSREIDPVTTDFAYARLIGDRKAVEEVSSRFDRIVVDTDERLDMWVPLLRSLLERTDRTYVFANNHYAGHAPETIRDLVHRIGGG